MGTSVKYTQYENAGGIAVNKINSVGLKWEVEKIKKHVYLLDSVI